MSKVSAPKAVGRNRWLRALNERLSKLSPVQEALFFWGTAFAAIVIAFIAYRPSAKIVATVCFLYLPLLAMNRRGEDYRDYGVTLGRWKTDLRWFLIFAAAITPLYIAGFVVFQRGVHLLPVPWVHVLTPLPPQMHFHFQWPDRFWEWVVDHLLVVALPEEFFYRGFIQQRLRASWPQGKMLWGARLGPAFLLTAVLFAVGHLAIFQVWRLAVFFPALLFGWLKEKTGTVMAAALFHAYCNLLEQVLEVSFFAGG